MPPEDGGGLVSTSAPRKGIADRRSRNRLIGGEVPGPESAAVGEHVLREGGRDLAPVERLGPLGSESFERLGELREAELVALAQRPAAGRIQLPRALEAAVDRREDVEDVGLLGVDRSPIPGEPDRRLDQVAERRPAEPAERLLQAGRRAWDAARSWADVERLGRLGVEMDRHRDQVGPPLDPVAAGGGDEEIDQDRVGPALVDHHEAAGAEAGERALDRE